MKKGLKDTNVKQSLPWMPVSAPRQLAGPPLSGVRAAAVPGKYRRRRATSFQGRGGVLSFTHAKGRRALSTSRNVKF